MFICLWLDTNGNYCILDTEDMTESVFDTNITANFCRHFGKQLFGISKNNGVLTLLDNAYTEVNNKKVLLQTKPKNNQGYPCLSFYKDLGTKVCYYFCEKESYLGKLLVNKPSNYSTLVLDTCFIESEDEKLVTKVIISCENLDSQYRYRAFKIYNIGYDNYQVKQVGSDWTLEKPVFKEKVKKLTLGGNNMVMGYTELKKTSNDLDLDAVDEEEIEDFVEDEDEDDFDDSISIKELSELSNLAFSNDIVHDMLNEAGKYRVLTADEEDKLMRSYKYDDNMDAFNALYNHNQRLVAHIARKYIGLAPLEDLIQTGGMGLMKAIQMFDVDRGLKLSTYATWWIKQSILRYIANESRMIRLPVHVAEKVYKFNRELRKLREQLGKEPSDAEIKKHLGYSRSEILDYKNYNDSFLSLETPVGEDGDTTFGDFIASAEDVESNTVHNDLHNTFQTIFDNKLDAREVDIIKRRFGFDGYNIQTLEEIGEIYSITRERVRQIESKAIRKLRHPSNQRLLEGFR